MSEALASAINSIVGEVRAESAAPATAEKPAESEAAAPVEDGEEAPAEEASEEPAEEGDEKEEGEEEKPEKASAAAFKRLRSERRKVREAKEALAKEREGFQAEVSEMRKSGAHLKTYLEAMARGDVKGSIEAITGMPFDDLIEHVRGAESDPTQREIRALRKQIEAREKAELEAREEAQRSQLTAHQEQARQAAMDALGERIGALGEEWGALAEWPTFRVQVARAMWQHEQEHGTKLGVRKASQAALEEIRRIHQDADKRISRLSGARTAEPAEPRSGSTKTAPRRVATGNGSTTGKSGPPSIMDLVNEMRSERKKV